MKNAILGTCLILSSLALGRTPMLRDVRLELGDVSKLDGGTSTFIRVYSNGDVVKAEVSALPRPSPERLLTRLDSYEMDRIHNLIEKARNGRIKFVGSAALCFAPATHTHLHTADNSKVLLKKGAVCDGGFYVNTSRSAQALVLKLESFRKLGQPIGLPVCPVTKVINCMPPVTPYVKKYCSNRAWYAKYCGTSFVD